MLRNWFVLAASLLLLQGCASTHIFQASEPVGGATRNPASADSFGPVEKLTPMECPGSGAVSEIHVKRRPLDSLLTVLTLGLYQSTRIEYYCAKEPDPVPTLGAGSSGGE